MKKMVLLSILFSIVALHGMEPSEHGCYVGMGMGNLPNEVQAIIVSCLHMYDNLDDIVIAIKTTSSTSKTLNAIINEKYGNPKGFRDLIRILSKNFSEFDEVQIAKKFGTMVAQNYIDLTEQLVKTVTDNESNAIEMAKVLIEKGADVNYIEVLDKAVFGENSSEEMVQFLLDQEGLDLKRKHHYEGYRTIAEEIDVVKDRYGSLHERVTNFKPLFEEAMEKQKLKCNKF